MTLQMSSLSTRLPTNCVLSQLASALQLASSPREAPARQRRHALLGGTHASATCALVLLTKGPTPQSQNSFGADARPRPDPNLALQHFRIFRQNRKCEARAFSPKSGRATLFLIGPPGLHDGIFFPSKHFNSFSKSLAKLHPQLAPLCYTMVIDPRTLQNENKMRNVCTPDFCQKCGMRASANLNPKMHKACIFVPG